MPGRVCDQLYCLLLGDQDIARSVLLEDGGADVVRCPTTAALVHSRDGWFLLDTGLTRQDYRPEFDLPRIRWQVVEGDAELVPGITALATPGRTPGHLAYRVETTDSGTWLFAFDAVLTKENVELDRTGGRTSPAGNQAALRASQERMVAVAEAEGARLVPGHCPAIWSTLRLPPEH